jgi:uncharacterized protein
MRFYLVLGIFLFYSIFKGLQLFPEHIFPVVLSVVLAFLLTVQGLFISRGAPENFHKLWYKTLAWSGSLLMGLWATFLVLSVASELLNLFWPGHSQEVTQYVALLSLGMSLIGFLKIAYGAKLKEVQVTIPGLKSELENFKIVQVSDLHVGPTIRKGYVEKVVRRVNGAQADLLVFTGDIADSRADSIKGEVQSLKDLRSRFGAYYVTGNHEYYWGAEKIIALFKSVGLKPLLNEHTILNFDGTRILLAGITDPVGGHLSSLHRPDLGKASSNKKEVDLRILLAHRPDPYLEAEALGFDLQLSGHTHSGQFFPLSLFMPLAHKYYRGLHLYKRMWINVNPGTGYWGPANRFGVFPEITLITFKSGN